MIALDHIALAAASLEAGIDYVRTRTGVTTPFGGQHPNMGTHNALTATGGDSYLEIIAPDPSQPTPKAPRAFGMDETDLSQPRIQTYLLRTDDIARDLAVARDHGFDLGEALEMSRGDLRWKIALHPDRRLTEGGAFPVLLEWPEGPHVSTNMDTQNLTLRQIFVTTPNPKPITTCFNALGFYDPRVRLMQGDPNITATYTTPDGKTATLGGPQD